MPELGEIRKAKETGHKGGDKFMWCACEDCGRERWVIFLRGKPKNKVCFSCQRGKNNPHWKGGRIKRWSGYIGIMLKPDDFFFPMADKDKYIPEHRLVMAKHLNRCLLPWEIVHHKNGIKDDNRLENLALLGGNSQHNKLLNKEIKNLQRQVGQLQERVTLLEAENVLLEAENAKR